MRIRILLLVGVAVVGGGTASVLTLEPADLDPPGTSQQVDRFPPLESAGPFVLAEINAKERGAWAHAWSTLYPGEQRVAPEQAYIRCERATPFTVPFESARVVRVRRALIPVPRLPQPLEGAAVTVRVTFAVGYGPRDPLVIRHTFHVVAAGGVWKWLLSPGRYAMYSRHRCS